MSRKTFVMLGLICAIGFGFWRLWENDAAINAVILFCTAGIVPGTNIELSPEQVYIVLGTILFLSIMVIFAKEVKRDIRAVRSAWRHWREKGGGFAAAEAVTEDIVAAAEAEVQEKEPLPRAKSRRKAALPAVAQSDAAKLVIVIPVAKGPSRFQLLWRMIRPRAIIAIGATLETIIKTADRSVVWISRTAMRAYAICMQAWLWLEPYLRKFDTWLERTLKSNKDVAAVLHLWSEFLKLASARIAELRARLTRIPRTPEE